MLRKVINFERGVEANLRGACPVGRDDGDRSYVAQPVGRDVAESVVSRRMDGGLRREVEVLRE